MNFRCWAVLLSLATLGGASRTASAQSEPNIAAPMVQLSMPAQLQSPAPAAAGYPVTGRVICADTQRAARFAQVTLIPSIESEGGFRGGQRLSARTDLDGNFIIPAAAPGDYYVTGAMTGYINSAQLVQSALSAGGDPAAALAGIPMVHVGAGGGTAVLSLQRGAVIAGSVQWDDGTPAAGISVSAQPVPPTSSGSSTSVTSTTLSQLPAFGRGNGFGGGFAGAQTDDRGRFRLSGLAPGSYYVRANVQAPSPQQVQGGYARALSISVYAPDKVRRADATPITLAAAEERDDLNIVLGLAGLHNVSGSVGSSSAAVRSGTVNLTDQTDGSLNRTGSIGPDGSFVVPYVPPGTYTMRISASSQAASTGRYGGGGSPSGSPVQFQPLQESVTVTDTDLTGLSVTVTPTTASP